MIFRIIFYLTVLHQCLSYDHNVFKSCAENELCTDLRDRAPADLYSVDQSHIAGTTHSTSIVLLSKDGSSPNLNLTVNFLSENRIRIQIRELDSERYQLQDVLDGEPEASENSFLFEDTEDDIRYISQDYTIIVKFDPFNIEVYKDTYLVQVIEGNRLLLQESGEFTLGVTFPNSVQLYGIHEHTDNLALQSTTLNKTDPYRLKNSDLSGHEINSPVALYGAIPVLYGHSINVTTGIFLHNAAEQWIDINNAGEDSNSSAYFMVKGGSLDLFLLLGPTPKDVVRQYVGLTGTAHLPQVWGLGHHQCRWSYMTQEDVKDVVANFNNYNFPLDAIWLDIDYTDGKKYFTWNPENFSDPLEMQQNISAANKRLVTIIDPHIKVEKGYNVYDGALEKDLFVKNSDGTNFEGVCWPGLSSYIDFLNPEATDYYASFYSYDNYPKSTPTLAGIWNDMNEPSVFDDSLEKTMPDNAVHHGDVLHKDIHNIYGFLHTKSTHQGLMARDNGTKRPFILTRSHFAGSQRYAFIWTGDNDAEWSHLAISIPECLNANILGIVFCGADVGGFAGNPDVELLQRWYQVGAWLPFYRAHAAEGTDRREPYLFDEGVQEIIRNAIDLRYKHIPFWYTLFYEHTRYRDPIIRPLFYEYPEDPLVLKIDDEFLVGTDVLVRAVTEPGVDSVQVYFPGGENTTWFSLYILEHVETVLDGFQTYEGNGWTNVPVTIDNIPVYCRGGSIIPTIGKKVLSTVELVDGAVMHSNIFFNKENTATGTYYLDDYESFDYRDNNRYAYKRFDAFVDPDTDEVHVNITDIDQQALKGDFKLKLGGISVYLPNQQPDSDKSVGSYTVQHFKTDVSGRSLVDFEFGATQMITLKLKPSLL